MSELNDLITQALVGAQLQATPRSSTDGGVGNIDPMAAAIQAELDGALTSVRQHVGVMLYDQSYGCRFQCSIVVMYHLYCI